MDNSYWLKQDPKKPLFPDLLWSRPEHRSSSGKITIIGGNTHGIAAVNTAYDTAKKTKVGEIRLVLPQSVKKTVPLAEEAVFVPVNPSGGFSKDGAAVIDSAVDWADATVLIGDNGRNSETAGVFEALLARTDSKIVITRDSIDLLGNTASDVLNRPNTCIVASFAQLQKLFQRAYFPQQLLFSQSLLKVVETLHKASITFDAILVTYHRESIIIAHSGTVVTTPIDNPMPIWRGSVATAAAVWWLQQPSEPLKSIACSVVA